MVAATSRSTEPPPEGVGGVSGWWSTLVRRKRHIDPVTLAVVAALTFLPFLMVVARVLAMPGGESTPLARLLPLHGLGAFLNEHLTFAGIPPADRPAILFLLLLPTGALLVSVFRLTLGIRVLGLRAILLAIGFQAIGILPSLALMVVIIGAIVLIRPWIRRIRLPMYARLTFILCLAVLIMAGAALVGPWLGSATIWRVAFFPVIIMAMIAEAVAKTLEKDDAVMAAWRGGWTITLALVLALVDGPAAQLGYHFPELIVTQLMAIVLLAELLDLRLLEEWPSRLSRYFAGVRPWYAGRPRVAVVRSRDAARSRSEGASVRAPVEALRELGFQVTVIEGDTRLVSELARALPADPRRGTPGGIVLNLATGVRGEARLAQVPALLEMAGIPFTGPGPLGHALLTDRFALMASLGRAQVPVPRTVLVNNPSEMFVIDFPALVVARCEPDAGRLVVRNRRAMRAVVGSIRKAHGQAAVATELVRGRRICAGLLGNDILECLPLVEILPGGRKACPAPLDATVADRVRLYAKAAFRAAACRDYARVDFRLPPSGDPVVVDLRWADLFARRGAFMTAAENAGYGFPAVMRRIVTDAARRYVATPASAPAASGTPVVSLEARRAAAG